MTAHPSASAVSLAGTYRQMLRIRRFEERVTELFRAQEIKGTAHSAIGQEAIAVGVGQSLRPTDYVVGHHRSHGHLLARGASMRRMMAELLGRRTGSCLGLGGSMHIAEMSLRVLGCNGVVGAGLPIGCGAAYASALHGTGDVTVVFFGDGAAAQGLVHEAMNLAAVWELPIVFVCENNQFALSASWRETRRVQDIAQRAAAYGMAGEVVDGNDVTAVHAAAARHIDRTRAGGGPSVLEAKTYRQMEHSMRANLPETRDLDERERWLRLDPVTRLRSSLTRDGQLDDDTADRIEEEIRSEVDDAVAFARSSEKPTVEDAHAALYAVPRPKPPAPEPEPGTRQMSYTQALREALTQEMAADQQVVLLGEDIAQLGGIFGVTRGLLERFGAGRVRNTPIAEGGFTGLAVGAAMTGLRPVVEIQIFDFITLAMDSLVNQAAKIRFMTGGQAQVPLVVRGPAGGGVKLAAQHSQSLEAWFAHVPGLAVAIPSTPYDAKGLLVAAIRDNNPVVFCEPKSLLFSTGDVPEQLYEVPLGKAAIRRAGQDVTLVSYGSAMPAAIRAADTLAGAGTSVEVIDLRTVKPLDIDTVLASVAKTNRLVIAHEAVGFAGVGAEIAAQVADAGIFSLDGPIRRVTAPELPMPYADHLEREVLPSWQRIVAAIESLP